MTASPGWSLRECNQPHALFFPYFSRQSRHRPVARFRNLSSDAITCCTWSRCSCHRTAGITSSLLLCATLCRPSMPCPVHSTRDWRLRRRSSICAAVIRASTLAGNVWSLRRSAARAPPRPSSAAWVPRACHPSLRRPDHETRRPRKIPSPILLFDRQPAAIEWESTKITNPPKQDEALARKSASWVIRMP